MQFITPLFPAYAEVFLLAMVCVILMLDLFVRDEQRWITYALTLATLLGCFLLTVLVVLASDAGPYTFSGMFVSDLMANVLKLGIYITVAVVLVYSQAYIRARDMFRGEFFVLALFAMLGMMVMVSANHLLTLYLGLELLSLSLYAMIALQRDSAVATEAAMKYFVLGALASGMLLYGMSMLYGATGTLELTRMAEVIAERRGGQHDTAVRAGVHRRRSRFQAFRRAVSHVGARRLSGRADRGDALYRVGAQAGGVRVRDAPAGERPGRGLPGRAVAVDAHHHGRALARDRQHYRDRANQPEAHARVFDDFTHGVPAARRARRQQRRLRVGDVLRHGLRADDARDFRHDICCCRAPASRPTGSRTSRGSTRAARGTRSSCCS